MLDEKKLLCAFVDSAYGAGHCGIASKNEHREQLRKFFREYLENGGYFPEKEIRNMHPELTKLIETHGIRNYIYFRHLDIVKKDIEKGTEQEFGDAIKNPLVRFAAVVCPVNLYKVLNVKDYKLTGQNIFIKTRTLLNVIEGLEIPNPGDIVSGHWETMLEIVTGWSELEEYKKTLEEYCSKLK